VPIIETRGLSKRFRVARKAPGLGGALAHLVRPRHDELVAVRALDLRIEAGESVAFLGPNGAGKSTTIKMLTGILVPTAGDVRVCGMVPHRQRVQNAGNIGVLFGQRTQLWWDLPVADSFRLLGDIYRIPPERFRSTLRDLIERFELGPLLRTPARQLSLGQRVRCDLAAILLHSPPILFLDEPTIGLDTAIKQRIRELIRVKHAERTAVVLTSHDLGDIEGVCDRAIMIDRGSVIFDGPVSEIARRFGVRKAFHIVLSEEVADARARAAGALAHLGPLEVEQPGPAELAVHFDAGLCTVGAIAGLLLPLLPVRDLRIEEPSLELVLRELYEGRLRPPPPGPAA
jgi:ABC-2 type transport system ATP-binding protein